MIFIQTVDNRALNARFITHMHVNKSTSTSGAKFDLIASVQGPTMPYVLGHYDTKENALNALTSVVLQLDDSNRTRANYIKAPSFSGTE
jgi:hypothetical protein